MNHLSVVCLAFEAAIRDSFNGILTEPDEDWSDEYKRAWRRAYDEALKVLEEFDETS